MRKSLIVGALAAAAAATAPAFAGGLASLDMSVYASGFAQPVAMVQHPTVPDTYIVVQQGGLAVVVQGGVVQATPFLSLIGSISVGSERGFLSLAFDPNYSTNRRFYVYFTSNSPTGAIVVARFQTQAANPLAADPSTRFDLALTSTTARYISHSSNTNHNGGNLQFGADGYLYFGVGDGGGAGDTPNNAQNPNQMLGKMMRVDVNVAAADAEGFDVPADNPFVDNVPINVLYDQIWSFGLRNPWRWFFDNFGYDRTNAAVIADVGQNAVEEVNFEPPGMGGRNYGWKRFEGNNLFSGGTPLAYEPHTPPIFTYTHATGFSITGGYVARGSTMCSYHGRYFYADYVSRRVWSFELSDAGVASGNVEHTADLLNGAGLPTISTWGRDNVTGRLFLVGYSTGTIYRITSTDAPLAGDLNFDGVVNFDDLNLLLNGYMGTPEDFAALNDLLGNYNMACPI